MSALGGDEKRVDWEVAKSCLARIHSFAPNLLRQGVLIGGIACWFYRNLLSKAQDLDFSIQKLSAAQEAVWLSKDIDFTNVFVEDARQMLREYLVKDDHGRVRLSVNNIPLGFAQVGVTFDPAQAWLDSWIGVFHHGGAEVEFRVLDPIALYREKQALAQKRGSQSDSLHLALLTEFLKHETLRQIEILNGAKVLKDRSLPIRFLFGIRERAPEICRDPRMRRRLLEQTAQSALLPPSERKLLEGLAELAS